MLKYGRPSPRASQQHDTTDPTTKLMSRGTSCGVAEEGNRYLQILWSNFADANLDVIRVPLDKI